MTNLTNITDNQISSKGVQSLADRPNANAQYGVGGLSSTQLKLRFDNLASFLAGKINELQDALASDTAADYIRIPLDDFGVGSLKDIVDGFASGDFANKILRLNPSAAAISTEPLQAIINDIAKVIAEHAGTITEHAGTITEHEALLVKSLEIGVIDGKLYLDIIRTKGEPERIALERNIFVPIPSDVVLGDKGSVVVRDADGKYSFVRCSSNGAINAVVISDEKGRMTLNNYPEQPTHATNKNYVDLGLLRTGFEAKSYTDTLRKDVNTALDNIDTRIENLEATNIIYEDYDGTQSQIRVPPTASPNAVVRLIGGLSQKSENLLPNGYAELIAQFVSLGGADLEEGVTYWLELDADPRDVQIEIYYPPESGFGSDYVQPGEFTAPISGTYQFNLDIRTDYTEQVCRLRIVKYTGIKRTEVKLLRCIDADGEVHYNYSVPSVKFDNSRFSLAEGLSNEDCNYLDLTRSIIVGNFVRKEFTGYEDWKAKPISGTGTVRYMTSLRNYELPYASYKDNGDVDFSVPAPAICDTYDVGSIYALNNGGYGFAISSSDVYFYDKNFPTVEAWQGYLQRRYESGNPLTVVYKIAKPHTEEVTLPYLAYLISVRDSAYINVLDKDGNLVEAPVSITFTKLRGT